MLGLLRLALIVPSRTRQVFAPSVHGSGSRGPPGLGVALEGWTPLRPRAARDHHREIIGGCAPCRCVVGWDPVRTRQ
jgi:hypothetical protein